MWLRVKNDLWRDMKTTTPLPICRDKQHYELSIWYESAVRCWHAKDLTSLFFIKSVFPISTFGSCCHKWGFSSVSTLMHCWGQQSALVVYACVRLVRWGWWDELQQHTTQSEKDFFWLQGLGCFCIATVSGVTTPLDSSTDEASELWSTWKTEKLLAS